MVPGDRVTGNFGLNDHRVIRSSDRLDLGVEPAKLHIGDARSLTEKLDGTEDASDARCRFRVADVPFHANDKERSGCLRGDCYHRAHLDRVAKCGACSVDFDHAEDVRSVVSVTQSTPEQQLL